MNRASTISRMAFTLIELMVAVAIIALLVSIMIPAFSAVRTNAKIVATQATFDSLKLGLESYRGENALGGVYPPSQTDYPGAILTMSNPYLPDQTTTVSGATLLVYALIGADRLGTPGFQDWDTDGQWHNDQWALPRSTNQPYGAYETNPDTLEPRNPRYPGRGAWYVDQTTANGTRTLTQLFDDGAMVTNPATEGLGADQPVFTDGWGRPILYYRANRGATAMMTTPGGTIGTYDQRDNAPLTGTGMPVDVGNFVGVDFGPGPQTGGYPSRIARGPTPVPSVNPKQADIQGNDNVFLDTFARFVHDRTIAARNQAVNRDSYLLISTGPDAIYGTSDDVVNWEQPD